MSINAEKIIAVRASKTIYRDGDTVLKVFDDNYSKADVLNEALNLARVEETGLPVSKVIDVLQLDGKWTIRSTYIHGQTLQKLMDDNPDKRAEYLNIFVELQKLVHSKEAVLMSNLKEKMNRRISDSELDAITQFELHTRLENLPRSKNLCHGDFKPSNIIITPENNPYIIDWSHATHGNAAADAVCTYLILLQKDEILAKDYLQLYLSVTDTSEDDIKKWIPIVAASQSVRAEKKERNFLLNLVDIYS